MRTLLDRPLSTSWCIAGWVVATGVFLAVVQAVGVATEDSQQTVYATWAIAHGNLACAFPPTDFTDFSPTAPLYPLVSGAVAALLRIGHTVPFPAPARFGHGCVRAENVMSEWSLHTRSLHPTIELAAPIAWCFLAAGVVAVLRASGRGRRGWEPVTLLLVAVAPGVLLCVCSVLHPEDLVAIGLVLGAVAAARTGRWGTAGVLVGLGVLSQQFALLVALPLLVLVPRPARGRYVGGAAIAYVIIALPLVVLTSGRALSTVLVGTGTSATDPSLLTMLVPAGHAQFALARFLPLALSAVLAYWVSSRLRAEALAPVPLLGLVATALSFRLLFDVAIWGYYLAAVSVSLLVLDALRGRLRLAVVAWMGLVLLASLDGVLMYDQRWLRLGVGWWQLAIDGTATALCAGPLLAAVRRRTGPLSEASLVESPV